MRHSKIDLTMNVYTDPKLLDVYGALDSLPSLDLNASPSTERPMMRATGTHDAAAFAGATAKSFVAPPVAPNSGKRGQTVSFAVISADDAGERMRRGASDEKPTKSSKKALPAVFADKAYRVETTGIEPATSGLQSQRSPS